MDSGRPPWAAGELKNYQIDDNGKKKLFTGGGQKLHTGRRVLPVASALLDIWSKGGIKVMCVQCCLPQEGQACRYAVSALPLCVVWTGMRDQWVKQSIEKLS